MVGVHDIVCETRKVVNIMKIPCIKIIISTIGGLSAMLLDSDNENQTHDTLQVAAVAKSWTPANLNCFPEYKNQPFIKRLKSIFLTIALVTSCNLFSDGI